mmetsp:Transcript_6497/g.11998  ORF Transcript_6497/g.11998 Transcript_6497/m.11998 type:complete len:1158 (+) Transcript_6497:123-3596(+)
MAGFLARALAKAITKAWLITLFLLPITCILLIGFAIPEFAIEDSLFNIWVRTRSEFREDLTYADRVAPPSGASSFLGIAVPRTGGNALTAQRLLEFRDRHIELEKVTVSVDGHTFYFEDICDMAAEAEAYVLPCLRMTVLDCFKEGDYNFDDKAAVRWRELVKDQLDPGTMIEAMKPPVVKNGLMQIMCPSQCDNDGFHREIAGLLGLDVGTWTEDPDCMGCIDPQYDSMDQPTRDTWFYLVVGELLKTPRYGKTTESLMVQYNTDDPRLATDKFLGEELSTLLSENLVGQTPYTFQLDPISKLGEPRPMLKNGSKIMSDADVLRHASGTCISWIHLIPPNVNLMLYGGATPVGFNATTSLTSVGALQSVYLLDRPKSIKRRVAMAGRPPEFGGPISISEDTGEKVLKEYKQKISEVWSKGWDDDSAGGLEMTAFVDDAGAAGTFANSLEDLTTSTGDLTIPYVVAIFLVTMLFYGSCSAVQTRSLTAFVGTLMAAICVVAAMGFTAIVGNKLNAVHLWCVPFLLMGVGIDDMFLVSNAAQSPPGNTPEEKLEATIDEVLSPITMTSLMNFILFLLMSVGSDIPGVYLAGVTGMVGIGLAYLTMITSYTSVMYLDIRRRDAQRYDLLCCIKSKKEEDINLKDYNYAFRYAYKPLFNNVVGRVVLVLVPFAVLVVAVIFLPGLERGLDLSDFFPADTREGLYTDRRDKYFPAWPVRICWGELKYEDPDVQMQMVSQWEKVLATKYIAGDALSSDSVWTAALAQWMLPCGPGQSCGPNADPMCRARYKANTKGLKTIEQGGVCLKNGSCPVIEGLNQDQIAKCIGIWNCAECLEWSGLFSGIVMKPEPSREPQVPIKYSSAGSTLLFAVNLKTILDYESLIETTRKVADDDNSIGRTFMAGIPYTYFEQYLTVVQVVSTLSGICLGIGFVVAWLFLFLELTAGGHGQVGGRLLASTLGAFIVAAFAGMAVVTTLGYNSALDINLNGFTAMAALLSLGLSVEYTVHVVHRFIQTDAPTALERVLVSMEFLFLPTFLGFLTTAISVFMLAFADFTFVRKYYFAPLAITTIVTYMYGIFALPALLTFCGCIPVLKAKEKDAAQATATTLITNPTVVGASEVVPPEPEKPEKPAEAPAEPNNEIQEPEPAWAPTSSDSGKVSI